MKTHNWQTKALTLFIAIAAFWLATACTEDSGLRIITPSAPCGDYYGEHRLIPSVEFQHFPGGLEAIQDGRVDYQDWSRAAIARNQRLRSQYERGQAILDKYRYLYRKNSYTRADGHAFGWGIGSLNTETGLPTDHDIINVRVDVHPRTLEHRIPECLDGFPVRFHYHPAFGEPLEFYP